MVVREITCGAAMKGKHMPLDQREVSAEDIHWDQDVSYGSYLSLDGLRKVSRIEIETTSMVETEDT